MRVFLLLLSLFSTGLIASEAIDRHPVIDTERLVAVYLDAVGRGELRVGKKTVSRDMIKPETVNYAYPLDGGQVKVTVHSKVIKAFPCPIAKGYFVDLIVAELDQNGSIIDVWYEVRP